jgi:hypothetical protein
VRGRRNQREEETGPRNLSTLEASVFYRGSLYIRCSSSANLLFKLPHISITYWWSRRSLLNCKQIHAAPSRSLFPLRSNTNPTTTNPTTPTPQPPPRQHQPHNHHPDNTNPTTTTDNTNPTTTTPTTPSPKPPPPSRSLFPLRANTNPTTTNPTTPTPQPPPRQHQPHNHHRQHQPHNHHPDNTNPTTTTPTTPFPPPPLQPCYHDHPVKGI